MTMHDETRPIECIGCRWPQEEPVGEAGEGMLKRLRSEGWIVAVHNDYRLNGRAHTFWLFTKGDFAAKGEGTSDAAALAEVVKQAARLAAAEKQQAAQAEELAKLAAFKAYVHKRLDDAGVPTDPESSHKAEGCRVGGRLDIAMAPFIKHAAAPAPEQAEELAKLRAVVATLPTDKNGNPIPYGATVKITGYDIGGCVDAEDDRLYTVLSLCNDHVWVSMGDDDQTCWNSNQCEVVVAAANTKAGE